MSDTITLTNVSFRIVGTFMRVNQPYTAVPPPTGFPFTLDIPKITIAQPPTVGSFMAELRNQLPNISPGYVFDYDNLPPPTRADTLNTVVFGPKGREFKLSAMDITKSLGDFKGPGGEKLGVAWQYYIFYKDEDTSYDTRVEVSGRARYTESLHLRDNCRVIWRLIVTYLNPNDGEKKTFVKGNGVESYAG